MCTEAVLFCISRLHFQPSRAHHPHPVRLSMSGSSGSSGTGHLFQFLMDKSVPKISASSKERLDLDLQSAKKARMTKSPNVALSMGSPASSTPATTPRVRLNLMRFRPPSPSDAGSTSPVAQEDTVPSPAVSPTHVPTLSPCTPKGQHAESGSTTPTAADFGPGRVDELLAEVVKSLATAPNAAEDAVAATVAKPEAYESLLVPGPVLAHAARPAWEPDAALAQPTMAPSSPSFDFEGLFSPDACADALAAPDALAVGAPSEDDLDRLLKRLEALPKLPVVQQEEEVWEVGRGMLSEAKFGRSLSAHGLGAHDMPNMFLARLEKRYRVNGECFATLSLRKSTAGREAVLYSTQVNSNHNGVLPNHLVLRACQALVETLQVMRDFNVPPNMDQATVLDKFKSWGREALGWVVQH